MADKYFMTTLMVQRRCEKIARDLRYKPPGPIYGVPRGGVPVAMMVAALLGYAVTDNPHEALAIVDDIIDSGATEERYKQFQKPFHALVDKRVEPDQNLGWVVFPWEVVDHADTSTDDIGLRLLQALGESPNRGGLKETPTRWLAYMREATSGIGKDPKELLKVFEDGAENVDEMVVVAGIPFYSMCEHHMAPFFGVAHAAYIPGHTRRIVGLSKIPRLVDLFAKRLQVQERLTNQIAETLYNDLNALGVGVVLRARHLCMEMRGIEKPGSITYTSAMRGAIKDKPEARSEFLRFVEMADSRMGAL